MYPDLQPARFAVAGFFMRHPVRFRRQGRRARLPLAGRQPRGAVEPPSQRAAGHSILSGPPGKSWRAFLSAGAFAYECQLHEFVFATGTGFCQFRLDRT